MDTLKKLTWLATDGGPFICLPDRHLPEWGGSVTGDYGRAITGDEYINVIPVGNGQGLAIHTEGNQIAWYPIGNDGKEGLFIVWVYADSESAIVSRLASIPENIWEEEELTFTNDDGRLTLLQAAESGNSPLTATFGLTLMPGTYGLFTAAYDPDDATSLVLHKIKLK